MEEQPEEQPELAEEQSDSRTAPGAGILSLPLIGQALAQELSQSSLTAPGAGILSVEQEVAQEVEQALAQSPPTAPGAASAVLQQPSVPQQSDILLLLQPANTLRRAAAASAVRVRVMVNSLVRHESPQSVRLVRVRPAYRGRAIIPAHRQTGSRSFLISRTEA